jgi:uncharacterized protein YjbJ (UPF0337 family)
MNSKTTQAEWNQIKGKISSKWSKFTDGDVEKFRDNMNLISEKLQKTYGHSKEKAYQEYSDFKKDLVTIATKSKS